MTMSPSSFAMPGALPACPGAFGGTTILVLPEDVSEEETKSWFELEKNDPIARFRRFHRLRIAEHDGARDLNSVLAALAKDNRKNVLVVPVVFCADSNQMQQMKQSVAQMENKMTIRWLPGLGGRRLSPIKQSAAH